MAKKAETKPKKADKFPLIDLVEKSEVKYTKIIMNLSANGLLEQFEKEKTARFYGCEIEPTITEAEFNKIVEA